MNTSLEPHLAEALANLDSLLPEPIAERLAPYIVDDDPPASIPHALLTDIARWARSDEGKTALQSRSLSPGDYCIESLLAGTITSPEGKFGTYVPPRDPEDIEQQRVRERKAIIALGNAVFSIAGVAFAAWWAADKTGWRNEWRVLFALFAAIVVALTEGCLYVIWLSRSNSEPKTRRIRRRPALHKKIDPEDDLPPPTSEELDKTDETTKTDIVAPIDDSATTALRQRRIA